MSHLYNVTEKHYPNSEALLTLSCKITFRMVSQLPHKGMALQQVRQTAPPSGSRTSSAGETEGGTLSSEGPTVRSSVPVLWLLVFTHSVENTSLSILSHKERCVCVGEKKKKVINTVKTQGLPGGSKAAIARGVQTQARQSLSGDKLRSLWQGLNPFL